jgi:lysophospholipase L1-like esterase
VNNQTLKIVEIGEKSLNWIKNIGLVLVTTVITLAIVEIILRVFLGDTLYSGKANRSLYYSKPTFALTKNGAVHYAPNTPLRSLAIYYNKFEYETKHHTNNLGFISDVNYTKEDKRGIIFLGDSFTAGVGSTTPWLNTLNHKYKDINLYSFGVTGTGQENFYRLFENFQNSLNYDTVVILSISDDLHRKLWYPIALEDRLYFCREKSTKEQCLKHYPIMHLIDYNLDRETLLVPDELYLKKAYRLLKTRVHNQLQNEKVKKYTPPKHIDIRYIADIKKLADKEGKRVLFIHIPEKSEVNTKEYRYNIAQELKDLGIEYYPILKTHKWDKSMYHIHDGHPNDKGYKHISNIVEEILIK